MTTNTEVQQGGELPLSVRDFEEWLDANRNYDVPEVHHELVAIYSAALAQRAASVPATDDHKLLMQYKREADALWKRVNAAESELAELRVASVPAQVVHYKDTDNSETWREAARQTREYLSDAVAILAAPIPAAPIPAASVPDAGLAQALKDIAESCNCCGDRADLAQIAQDALDALAAAAPQAPGKP